METGLTNAIVYYDDVYLRNIDKYYKCWRDIRLAEAAEIHSKWMKTRAEDYSGEVRNMLIEGTKVTAVEYLHAMNITKDIKNDFLSIFDNNVYQLLLFLLLALTKKQLVLMTMFLKLDELYSKIQLYLTVRAYHQLAFQ